MAFFTSTVTTLQTLVVALGAGLGIWGVVNLLEGYGSDNPGAKLEGILLTKYQSRTNLCGSIKEMVEAQYANDIHIFSEPVAYSIKAAEQSVNGTSIFELDAKSSIAKAYLTLAREVTANA